MESAAPAKRQWKGRTDEQKAERAKKRQEQKSGLNARQARTSTGKKPTKVQRVFNILDEWKPEELGFTAGIKEIEFGPDFVVQDITGHNGRTGSLNLDNLKPMADDPVISVSAPKLKTLDLRRAINAAQQEDYYDVLRAVTRPEGRKNKLEVLFQHPTYHWEKGYKNGREKQPRMTQAMKEKEMLEEVMWAVKGNRGFDIDDEDDGYGTDYSAISAIVHGAM
ncbi:hypothetical protein J4E83_003632 [Alternaria metachromatica]|uniref:uncharacterized protein n=1 Tax=Alternaria metachromatica TaxID=283354 RepID=UPI0020C3C515|nr:uncharacterized protein J4E83_003632 [Alternaria metachromatica]KAI4626481.1 hypothetical protein J4E83_003632 [Alternaria metachromatica]